MNGKILFSACVVIVAAIPPSAARTSKAMRCLALGVGTWTPSPPGDIWRSSRRLNMTSAIDSWLSTFAGRHGWRVIQFVPDEPKAEASSPAPEYDRAWLWLATTPDSLLLLRPAMLSEGMEVRGAWTGDTLRGRAHAFSDAIDIVNGIARSPRANAYGVRDACKESEAAAIAAAAVERLRSADQPDTALAAHEDSIWTAKVSRQLEQD